MKSITKKHTGLKITSVILTLAVVFTVFAMLPIIGVSADGAVCKIGETTYNTVQEAVNAAVEGDTITMIADYRTNTPASNLLIVNKNNLTLDLAGFTFSDGTDVASMSGATSGIVVNTGIKFTLTSSAATKGKVYKTNRMDGFSYVVYSNKNADVTITNVEINGAGGGNNGPIINAADSSKLYIDNCVIKGIKSGNQTSSTGIDVSAKSTVDVKNTAISMCYNDISVSNADAVVNLDNVTLTSDFTRDGANTTDLSVSAGTVNVTNSTFKGTTAVRNRIISVNKGTVNVTNTEITNSANTAPLTIWGTGTLNLYDGTHVKTTTANSAFAITNAAAVVNLYGGLYESKVSFLEGETNAASFVLKDGAKAANENNSDISSTYLTSIDSEYVRITKDDLNKVYSAIFVIEASTDNILEGQTWEKGQYSMSNGSKEIYNDRYRIADLVDVVSGMTYKFYIGADAHGYQYVLRGYSETGTFVKSLGAVANNKTFTIPSGVAKISITIYNDSVSSGTTLKYLTDGTFTPSITNEKSTIGSKFSNDKGEVTLWQDITMPGKNTFVGWKDASDNLYPASANTTIDGTKIFTAVGMNLSMETGAAIRWAESHDDRGIRFRTMVKDADLANIASVGTVSTGTIIAPYTSSVTADSFTVDGINSLDGMNVVNSQNKLYKTSNGTYYYGGIKGMCIITNPAEQTQHEDSSKVVTTKLAARGYVSVTYSDTTVKVFYTDFNSTDNVRSMQDVANAAYADSAMNYSALQKEILVKQYGATGVAGDYLKESSEDAVAE